MSRHQPIELPLGELNTEFLAHLFAQLPGGEYIAPHVSDGPWYIVAVTEWDEPNWQLVACLQAYPGIAGDPDLEDPMGGQVQSWHVVPKFIWRMCQWHSTECEAQVDTEDYWAAGPFDTKPSDEVVAAHIASFTSETA